jgi:hypothetical protein
LTAREAMKVARAKGRWRGQQPQLNQRQEAHLVARLNGGECSAVELADLFGVVRSTVYRACGRERASVTVGVGTAGGQVVAVSGRHTLRDTDHHRQPQASDSAGGPLPSETGSHGSMYEVVAGVALACRVTLQARYAPEMARSLLQLLHNPLGRECWCDPECWCRRTALGRAVRWWFPGRYLGLHHKSQATAGDWKGRHGPTRP